MCVRVCGLAGCRTCSDMSQSFPLVHNPGNMCALEEAQSWRTVCLHWEVSCSLLFFSFLFYLKLACAGHVAGCIEAKEAKHYARVLEVLYGCQLIPKRTRWHLDCTRAPRQHSGSLRPHTLLLLWSLVVMDRCVKTVFLLSSNGQQWVNGAPVWSN